MKFAGYDFDEKFIVIKKENLKHLTDEEREELYDMLDKINEGRMREGKTNHGHLVVSCDEEYASEVANIIAEYHDIKKIKEVNKGEKVEIYNLEKGERFIYEEIKYEKVGSNRFWHSNDPLETAKYMCKRLEDREKIPFAEDIIVERL